jgi:hypothetical protein
MALTISDQTAIIDRAFRDLGTPLPDAVSRHGVAGIPPACSRDPRRAWAREVQQGSVPRSCGAGDP